MTRKLVIFDLDETLVHASKSRLLHSPSCFDYAGYSVYERPFVRELLTSTAPFYDFAVWSSSSTEYVEAVVYQVFGAEFALKFAWSVERCIQRVHAQSNGYVYVKDLRKVQSQGYRVEQITMVDDSPEKLVRQPRNHLHIKPFLGQIDDRELLVIADELIRRAG